MRMTCAGEPSIRQSPRSSANSLGRSLQQPQDRLRYMPFETRLDRLVGRLRLAPQEHAIPVGSSPGRNRFARLFVGGGVTPVRDFGRCVVVVGMLAGSFGGFRLASASCTGPVLTVEPRAVKPGEALTITGKAFSNAPCNDQGETGGCFGSGKTKIEPIRGIELFRTSLRCAALSANLSGQLPHIFRLGCLARRMLPGHSRDRSCRSIGTIRPRNARNPGCAEMPGIGAGPFPTFGRASTLVSTNSGARQSLKPPGWARGRLPLLTVEDGGTGDLKGSLCRPAAALDLASVVAAHITAAGVQHREARGDPARQKLPSALVHRSAQPWQKMLSDPAARPTLFCHVFATPFRRGFSSGARNTL